MKRLNFKFVILNSIIIFILACISHFVFDLLENDITTIFFPVNESIWEHMKLLFTPYLIDIILLYIFTKKLGIVYHNFMFSAIVSSIFSISLYLVIYLPIFNIFGFNLAFDIFLLFVVIFISQIVQYILLIKEEQNFNLFSLVLFIIISLLFGYFTYRPIRNYVFYDYKDNKFGKNIYILGN